MNTDVFGSVTAGCCRCTIDCRDQLLSVRLSGEIDQAGAAVLREKIDQAAESCLPQTLMLDFSGVTFMDSSGIGLGVERYRMMKTMDGELLVTGASPRVKRLMQMGGLDKLPIFGGSVRPEKA